MVDIPALLIFSYWPQCADSFHSLSLLQSLLVTRTALPLCLHTQERGATSYRSLLGCSIGYAVEGTSITRYFCLPF
jgi:hypothetical protein